MRKIATPTELDAELTTLLRSNRQGATREDLEASLRGIADRLSARAGHPLVPGIAKLATSLKDILDSLEEEQTKLERATSGKYDSKNESHYARIRSLRQVVADLRSAVDPIDSALKLAKNSFPAGGAHPNSLDALIG